MVEVDPVSGILEHALFLCQHRDLRHRALAPVLGHGWPSRSRRTDAGRGCFGAGRSDQYLLGGGNHAFCIDKPHPGLFSSDTVTPAYLMQTYTLPAL